MLTIYGLQIVLNCTRLWAKLIKFKRTMNNIYYNRVNQRVCFATETLHNVEMWYVIQLRTKLADVVASDHV